MFSSIWNVCKSLFHRIKKTVKHWSKPASLSLAIGAISDLTRSHKDLVVENAILRQQLLVLNRCVKRPFLMVNGE